MKSLFSLVLLPLCAAAWTYNTDDSCKKSESEPSYYGSSVLWHSDPEVAFKKAEKENKPVFLLHISGDFKDPKLTWNNAQKLRVGALSDKKLGKIINENFIATFEKVATFQIINGVKLGGNVISYFLNPDKKVISAVGGTTHPAVLIDEAKWITTAWTKSNKIDKENNKSDSTEEKLISEINIRMSGDKPGNKHIKTVYYEDIAGKKICLKSSVVVFKKALPQLQDVSKEIMRLVGLVTKEQRKDIDEWIKKGLDHAKQEFTLKNSQ